MVLPQIRPRLQHSLPIGRRITQYFRDMALHILVDAEGLGAWSVNRLHQILWKHQQGDRVRAERRKRTVRDESQLIEERPMNDRAELPLAHEGDHLLKRKR